MPTVSFQSVHRPRRSPSQRFRYEQYLGWFQENGWDVEQSGLLHEGDDPVYYAQGQWLSKAWLIGSASIKRALEVKRMHPDVAFVQREAHMLGSAWFEQQMARKSALVYDFDDAIWLADVSEKNKRFAFLKNGNKTADICSIAHEVIVGNAYLAGYAKRFNPNVTIIPTTIDTAYHRPLPEKRRKGRICIGWTGSLTTVQYFHRFSPVLERLKMEYKDRLEFLLIGEPEYRNDALELQGKAWRLETEVEDLNAMHIGIMPLPDNPWTRGKCGFKGLQYMACGIPAVLSAVGVNTEIIEDGVNGFLAESDDEWFEKLCLLIESEDLRERLGQAGKATVEARYSVRSQRDRYLDVLNRALAQKPSPAV